jgi:hypothetical protein
VIISSRKREKLFFGLKFRLKKLFESITEGKKITFQHSSKQKERRMRE